MEIVEKIRERFPSPKSIKDLRDRKEYPIIRTDDYCVGGAACFFVGKKINFPGKIQLGETIQELNPRISKEVAEDIASRIISANDKRDFEKAWLILKDIEFI